MVKNPSISKLVREIKCYYKASGRGHLPWRGTRDPYKILVSEVMLQQTQVNRVVPYYERWIKKFPTAKKLAGTRLSDVLVMWQGLGYNRRGKYLWEAAKVIAVTKIPKKGEMNTTPTPFFETFGRLPGVGPYTRGAVETFAFNTPNVFIETNIRTVFIHFCFANTRRKVSDQTLLPLVGQALTESKMQPCKFYWALMDYGSYLKGQGVKLNARSKHYVKQTKFEGSTRQKRAALLRKLLAKGASEKELQKVLHSK